MSQLQQVVGNTEASGNRRWLFVFFVSMNKSAAKEFFDAWRSELLTAIIKLPEAMDSAQVLGYGSIILRVQDGKITFVELAPAMRPEKDSLRD